MNFVSLVKDCLQDVPGWRTSRRILVIESDDWGAIRTRDRRSLAALEKTTCGTQLSEYDQLDTLESGKDLYRLADVLSGVHDANGNPACLTTNVVLCNPDFDLIRESGFEEYFSESFLDSYKRYRGEDLSEQWQELVQSQLFRPQFHNREHLHVPAWMEDLRNRVSAAREAFDQDFYAYKWRDENGKRRSHLAALRCRSPDDLFWMEGSLEDGLTRFDAVFGYRSKTMVPCNYVLPGQLEAVLKDSGVRGLQGTRVGFRPDGQSLVLHRRYLGSKTSLGMLELVRNVQFEPYRWRSASELDTALQGVARSFRLGKPAVLSTHRINYVSGMNASRCEKHLGYLSELLKACTRRWSDIEFMSSDQLLEAVEAGQ